MHQSTSQTAAMGKRVKDLEQQVQKKDKLLVDQAQSLRRASQQAKAQEALAKLASDQARPASNKMNTKWAETTPASNQKTTSGSESEKAARVRALREKLARDEELAAEKTLSFAQRTIARGDRSRSKGKGGGVSDRLM